MIQSGTYFGTQAEYDALNIEAHLATGSLIKVDVVNNWVGAVINWAEGEALQVVGGIVSLELQISYLSLYLLISR